MIYIILYTLSYKNSKPQYAIIWLTQNFPEEYYVFWKNIMASHLMHSEYVY